MGTPTAMLRSGKNALIEDTRDLDNPERTEDASTLDQTFLDALQYADNTGATDSPDDGVLIKFASVFGAEVWFDVTDYLEGVRTGATDNGIAVKNAGTADGWQVHANGSTTPDARPRLVVYSADLGNE